MRIVAQDFSRRVVEDGEKADYLVYMFFPGRNVEVARAHGRVMWASLVAPR